MAVVDEDERSLSPVTPRTRTRAALRDASASSAHAEAIKQLEDMAMGYAMHTHELEATIAAMRAREQEQTRKISDLEQVVRDNRVSAKDMQELEHMAAGYAAQVTELKSRVAVLVGEREASALQTEQLLKDATHAEEFAKVVVTQKQRLAELEGSLASCEQAAAARAAELQRRARGAEERSERLETVVAELRAKLRDAEATPRMTQECVSKSDVDSEIRRRMQLEAEVCSLKLAEQEHLGRIAELQEALQTQSMQTVHLCPSVREKDAQRIAELEALASEMRAQAEEHLQEIAQLRGGGPPGAVQEARAKAREMEELAIGHARRSHELEALACDLREAEQDHLEEIRVLRMSCAASEGLASERAKELEGIAAQQGHHGTEAEAILQSRVAELEEQLAARARRCSELEAAQGVLQQTEAELHELRDRVAQQERDCESAQHDYSCTLEQLRSCRLREQEVGSHVAMLEAEVEAHRQREAERVSAAKAAEAPVPFLERLASIPAAAATRAPTQPAEVTQVAAPTTPSRLAASPQLAGPAGPPAVRVACAEGRCASPIQVRATVPAVGKQAMLQNAARHAAQQRCASPVVVRRTRCTTPVRCRLASGAQEVQQHRCASPLLSRPSWQQQGAAEAPQRTASPIQPRTARAEPVAPQARPAWASQPASMVSLEGTFGSQDRSWSTATAPTMALPVQRVPFQH